MPVTINGTSGIVNNATDLNYTGTLTGGTGVVNLGSGQVYKDASGNVGIGTSSPEVKLDVAGDILINNNSYLYGENSIGGNSKLIGRASDDTLYVGDSAYNNPTIIQAGNNYIGFVANGSERARIDSSGNLLVGTTSATNLPGGGTSNAQGISVGSNQIRACRDEYTFQIGVTNTGANRILQQFFQAGTNCGQIVVSNSNATAYQTSSDYRLKHNPQPMVNALATVAALKPCTWTWKNSGTPGQGFIAHEVQEYFPDAVSGEKDGVDEAGKPKYQGIDTSFLVATLTAAIQELKAELDSVKAELATLKGAQA